MSKYNNYHRDKKYKMSEAIKKKGGKRKEEQGKRSEKEGKERQNGQSQEQETRS